MFSSFEDATGMPIKVGDEVVHFSFSSSGVYSRQAKVEALTPKRIKLSTGASVMGHTCVVITGRRTVV